MSKRRKRPPPSYPEDHPLTDKQRAFVREYLIDGNATAAAKRAGYSERSAMQQAVQLLKYAHVAKAIREGQAQLAEQASVTAQMVIEGLHKEATNYDEGSTHSARVAAWAHLGKHLGMFTEKQEHSGGVAIRIIRD